MYVTDQIHKLSAEYELRIVTTGEGITASLHAHRNGRAVLIEAGKPTWGLEAVINRLYLAAKANGLI